MDNLFTEENNRLWQEEFELLPASKKKLFQDAANKLLGYGFIIKSKNELTDTYFFIINNENLFNGYFGVIGWELKVDKDLGVVSIKNQEKRNRLNLKLHDSITLLILRLIYEQKHDAVNLNNFVEITISDIHDMYSTMGLTSKLMNKAQLRTVLSLLKRYNIIDIDNTQTVEPSKKLYIMPSILFAIDTDSITDVYKLLRGYSSSDGGEDNETSKED